jgi:regulator of protease activity HflC (stomatin/prohibitin superfamily)
VVVNVALRFAGSFFEVVDPGFRGVKVIFGDMTQESLEEGLHFKSPWTSIYEIEVRERVVNAKAGAASSDLQSVSTQVAVNFRGDPDMVWWLYQNIGVTVETWEHTKLNPIIQETVKAVTAKYTAENVIKNREDVKKSIEDTIIMRAKQSNLLVTAVNITDFSFSEAFDRAIEAKVQAEQDFFRSQNELKKEEVEAQKTVVKAEADKKIRELKAKGERTATEEAAAGSAKQIELESIAQAEAIKRTADAQAEANKALLATLDPRILEFKKLEKWDGALPRVSGGKDSIVLIDPEKK